MRILFFFYDEKICDMSSYRKSHDIDLIQEVLKPYLYEDIISMIIMYCRWETSTFANAKYILDKRRCFCKGDVYNDYCNNCGNLPPIYCFCSTDNKYKIPIERVLKSFKYYNPGHSKKNGAPKHIINIYKISDSEYIYEYTKYYSINTDIETYYSNNTDVDSYVVKFDKTLQDIYEHRLTQHEKELFMEIPMN